MTSPYNIAIEGCLFTAQYVSCCKERSPSDWLVVINYIIDKFIFKIPTSVG